MSMRWPPLAPPASQPYGETLKRVPSGLHRQRALAIAGDLHRRAAGGCAKGHLGRAADGRRRGRQGDQDVGE